MFWAPTSCPSPAASAPIQPAAFSSTLPSAPSTSLDAEPPPSSNPSLNPPRPTQRALDRSNRPDPHTFGHIRGAPPGTSWPSRAEVSQAGVHAPYQAGISGTEDRGGAVSVVLNDGYPDGDGGEIVWYMGSGGFTCPLTRKKCNKMQHNQDPDNIYNRALQQSLNSGQPVRVIRGPHAKHSPWAPEQGYRYDGLYRLTHSQAIVDPSGNTNFSCLLWRMERIETNDYQIPVKAGFRMQAEIQSTQARQRKWEEDQAAQLGFATSANQLLERNKALTARPSFKSSSSLHRSHPQEPQRSSADSPSCPIQKPLKLTLPLSKPPKQSPVTNYPVSAPSVPSKSFDFPQSLPLKQAMAHLKFKSTKPPKPAAPPSPPALPLLKSPLPSTGQSWSSFDNSSLRVPPSPPALPPLKTSLPSAGQFSSSFGNPSLRAPPSPPALPPPRCPPSRTGPSQSSVDNLSLPVPSLPPALPPLERPLACAGPSQSSVDSPSSGSLAIRSRPDLTTPILVKENDLRQSPGPSHSLLAATGDILPASEHELSRPFPPTRTSEYRDIFPARDRIPVGRSATAIGTHDLSSCSTRMPPQRGNSTLGPAGIQSPARYIRDRSPTSSYRNRRSISPRRQPSSSRRRSPIPYPPCRLRSHFPLPRKLSSILFIPARPRIPHPRRSPIPLPRRLSPVPSPRRRPPMSPPFRSSSILPPRRRHSISPPRRRHSISPPRRRPSISPPRRRSPSRFSPSPPIRPSSIPPSRRCSPISTSQKFSSASPPGVLCKMPSATSSIPTCRRESLLLARSPSPDPAPGSFASQSMVPLHRPPHTARQNPDRLPGEAHESLYRNLGCENSARDILEACSSQPAPYLPKFFQSRAPCTSNAPRSPALSDVNFNESSDARPSLFVSRSRQTQRQDPDSLPQVDKQLENFDSMDCGSNQLTNVNSTKLFRSSTPTSALCAWGDPSELDERSKSDLARPDLPSPRCSRPRCLSDMSLDSNFMDLPGPNLSTERPPDAQLLDGKRAAHCVQAQIPPDNPSGLEASDASPVAQSPAVGMSAESPHQNPNGVETSAVIPVAQPLAVEFTAERAQSEGPHHSKNGAEAIGAFPKLEKAPRQGCHGNACGLLDEECGMELNTSSPPHRSTSPFSGAIKRESTPSDSQADMLDPRTPASGSLIDDRETYGFDPDELAAFVTDERLAELDLKDDLDGLPIEHDPVTDKYFVGGCELIDDGEDGGSDHDGVSIELDLDDFT